MDFRLLLKGEAMHFGKESERFSIPYPIPSVLGAFTTRLKLKSSVGFTKIVSRARRLPNRS